MFEPKTHALNWLIDDDKAVHFGLELAATQLIVSIEVILISQIPFHKRPAIEKGDRPDKDQNFLNDALRGRSSYPSGHMIGLSTLMFKGWEHYGWKVGLPATIATIFTGWARVQAGEHYLTDVVGNGTLTIQFGTTDYDPGTDFATGDDDYNGFTPNEDKKTLTVTIDKPFYAQVQLHVSGDIRSDVVFTPGSVQLGSVDEGTSSLNYVPEEKERGTTITSGVYALDWDGLHLTIVDTPGDSNFQADGRIALAALDAAVVVLSAAGGAKVGTERMWRFCQDAGIPTVAYVSGIDKEAVGQTAANIRRVRPPEPYKGKGIRYAGEHVRRKAGKAGIR